MSRVRTVFLGSGRFGVEPLRRLDGHPDIELVGVVTAPPRPAGRRLTLSATPVDDAARALGVGALLRPARLREPGAVDAILALGPWLAVLADYGQIVPRALLELPLGALNLHPSLLPRHRGATPIPATILAGDRETGVTLFRMDEGLDTGPIVARERIALDGTETASGLEERLERLAGALLASSLGPWVRGELTAVPQSEEGVTLTRPLRRADGRLDPARSADELERRVRAYRPWPGTFLDGPDARLVVHRAHVERADPGDVPGRLVGHRDGLAFATASGRLVLDEVQPAGGRPMTGAELRRGRPRIVASG